MKKTFVTLVAVAVVALAIVIVGPVLYRLMSSPGAHTGEFNLDGAPPAEVGVDGDWEVIHSALGFETGVGYTFDELLPGDARNTSGLTRDVTGNVKVVDGELTGGDITVNMETLTTDNERRDVNVRMSLFVTDEFPEATFTVTEPVDVSDVPAEPDVTVVDVVGDLTIRGVTHEVTAPMEVTRTGDYVLLSSDVPINRLDYGIRTPDFIAASIDEEGLLNIRLVLEQT